MAPTATITPLTAPPEQNAAVSLAARIEDGGTPLPDSEILTVSWTIQGPSQRVTPSGATPTFTPTEPGSFTFSVQIALDGQPSISAVRTPSTSSPHR